MPPTNPNPNPSLRALQPDAIHPEAARCLPLTLTLALAYAHYSLTLSIRRQLDAFH